MTEPRSPRFFSRFPRGGAASALLALLLFFPACSAGGDEGGSDPLSCTLNTGFSGRGSAVGTIILQTASTSCGQLSLNVVFTGISKVFTVGFDITYPTAAFAFDGFTQGPLLKQGSPSMPPFFSVTEPSHGRVAVFASRFSPDGSVDAAGDTVLLTLRFRAVALGSGPVVFDLSPTPVQDQVLDETGGAVSATFANGTNLAQVY